jgi:hypothetical protein
MRYVELMLCTFAFLRCTYNYTYNRDPTTLIRQCLASCVACLMRAHQCLIACYTWYSAIS